VTGGAIKKTLGKPDDLLMMSKYGQSAGLRKQRLPAICLQMPVFAI
jgi:hypothetical protein